MTADDFDEPPQDIGCYRILPGCSGMIDQRQVRQHVHYVRQRRGGIKHLSLVVGLADGCSGVEDTVGRSRTPAQQMPNSDRSVSALSLSPCVLAWGRGT